VLFTILGVLKLDTNDNQLARCTVCGNRIVWFCQFCDMPIRSGSGYLALDRSADGWVAMHSTCAHRPAPSDSIAVEQIGTVHNFVDWAGAWVAKA
jgi:hypothetical protein